ncbi:MAG: hypothetical protein WA991_00750 [Ornithinimicrobium sp.]
MSYVTPPTGSQELAGRVAGGLVAAEATAIAGCAAFYLQGLLRGQGSDTVVVLMSIVTMLVFVVGLAYVAVGLWRRHPRSQAPAMAFNLLLVPLGIALFPLTSPFLAGVILLSGVSVIFAAFQMGQLD